MTARCALGARNVVACGRGCADELSLRRSSAASLPIAAPHFPLRAPASVLAQVPMGGGGAVRVSHCPGCGQATFQPNRLNLVRCWACAQHYCAACKQLLRGKVGLHYVKANGCKQHA